MHLTGYIGYYAKKAARKYLGLFREEGLGSVRENWEAIGAHDPLWGVLTDPAKRGNRWDEGEFYATGVREVAELVEYVRRMEPGHTFERALDFGCGVGRLSFALAAHYARVDGVDISKGMLSRATAKNTYGERVAFVHNESATLPFGDGTFDLVYSNIVLQHMDRKDALGFVREFIRVVKPGGLAVFQAPSSGKAGQATRYTTPVDTPDGVYTISMNVIPRGEVEAAVAEAGGRVVDIVTNTSAGAGFESVRYCATRG